MSDVNYVRNTLIQTGEHCGELIARLVEIQKEMDHITETITTVTSGSENPEIQKALATYALARENIAAQVQGPMGTAHEHVQNYFSQL
ncbi:hypothetical protein AB0L88_44380 [Saccharopolyspora shandongensis]|uniref:hypothetical protein n=1 Tax=Saccharopolyspora shandongensis TaxID=418495 RepID=UPI003444DF9B